MDNFEIQDAQRLLSQAGDLAQINQNIMRVKEQLDECIAQVNNAWQSDTQDRESYLSGIQKNIGKIDTLCAAIRSLSNKLNDFAEQSIRVSNNS